MTVGILFMTIFLLGFVADPIINMYFDPWSYLMPWASSRYHDYGYDEPASWSEHFAKGFAGMGVIGFLKVLVASPFTYFRVGGRGRARAGRAATGRDRVEQVGWVVIAIGVFTALSVSAFMCSTGASLTDAGNLQRCASMESSRTRESPRTSHGRPTRR